jgi:hypothetical protein
VTENSINKEREYLLHAILFSSPVATAEEAVIVGAMRRLERETSISSARCVEFRPKVAADVLYIKITDGAGCSSNVSLSHREICFSCETSLYSMQVGQPPPSASYNHTVTLNKTGCLIDGIIMHEFLHTLGESDYNWKGTVYTRSCRSFLSHAF